jgi:uncharacterized protein (TIGR03435 family)
MLIVAFAASGQPAFEVASIKPAPLQEQGRISSRHSVDSARLNYTNVSLADLAAEAFRVQHTQVSGPDWLNAARFDLMAKIPAGAGRDGIPEMLRALLAERFAMKFHEETKELPMYELLAAKGGPRMVKADSTTGISNHTGNAGSHVTAKITLANLADFLSAQTDKPVVDHTGLEGAYAIDLAWGPDTPDAALPSIFTALQEQLGLRLVAEKGPVRLLVIDHIDKVPSEN